MTEKINSKSKSLREKMFNKYTGPTNKVHLQVDFDPKTGEIYDKLHDRGTAFITLMDSRRKEPFYIFIQIDFTGIFLLVYIIIMIIIMYLDKVLN